MSIRLAQAPFLSVQGEGPRTGRLTIFVRFMGCNLRCAGFSQKDPTDPTSYIQPILVDPKSIKTLADFPVCEVGCDTLYAVDPAYKHLAIDYASAEELVTVIENLLPTDSRFGATGAPSWGHPKTKNTYDICFTGGEPLLQQNAIIEILKELDSRRPVTFEVYTPEVIQFETNGTQKLTPDFSAFISQYNVLFNVSPKLFNVTGEKAWCPEIINSYHKMGGNIALKFVVNDTKEAFDELDCKVEEIYRGYPIYVMPIGSSHKQQNDYYTINKIAKMAIERGYHISGRLHCNIFGNSTDR